MNPKKFFSELERRRVFRVSIAYGVSASIIAQIVDMILESFEAEPWVMKMIIIILFVGFPVSLILSWVFDIGPKGIEKTPSKEGDATDDSNPISVKIVIGILIAIIVFGMAGLWSWNEFGSTKKGAIKSLAILPFDNFTGSDSLEYFVAGVQSSLIGDMQKISALRVPSKTSSNSFTDSNITIPEIANLLNVDAAIEGAITCMGTDSICVQIRLVRVFPEEQQLWVEDYKVEKSQILSFYHEVTKQISKEIDIVLTPEEDRLLAKSRIVKPEAYDAYLKGVFYWGKLDEESVKKALKSFQLATELDPEWADPYAGLANAWGLLGFFGYEPRAVTLPNVYPNLNKALELDPNSAKAHYVAAIIAVWTEWDWEKGEREFLRTIELNPNDALSHMYYAHLLMILRRTDEANQQADIGLRLDPMKALVLGLYGVVVRCNNDDKKGALQAFEKSLSIDSNFVFGKINLNEVKMEIAYENGEYKKWIELWNKKVVNFGHWNDEGREAVLKTFNEKGHIAAIEEMFRMNDKYGNDCYMSGGVKAERYVMLGNIDKAMESLEESYEEKGTMMPYISPKYPNYEQFKDNPRYIEVLKKMNLPYE